VCADRQMRSYVEVTHMQLTNAGAPLWRSWGMLPGKVLKQSVPYEMKLDKKE